MGLMFWIKGLLGGSGGNLKERGVDELTRIADLDAVVNASAETPQFIFKHSTSCPISAGAHRQVVRYLDEREGDAPPVHLVKVIESRPVSNEIASRLGVTHQSPQMILLEGGAARWNASHQSITADALSQAATKS